MRKPLVLDLFSGLWGWTEGFIAQGWQSIGIDLKIPRSIPEGARFSEFDILQLTPKHIRSLRPNFIVCSSPCEQFSVHCMKHFHKNPPYPALGLHLFQHSQMLCESSGVPYVMENVRCAERFVGKCVNHCGPFYFWGSGVPAVMPKELYKLSKGTHDIKGVPINRSKRYFRGAGERWQQASQFWSGSSKRQECTAEIAKIPFAISSYIASCALQIISYSATATHCNGYPRHREGK